MQPIIEVRDLGKKYDIDHQRGGYVMFRDVLANVVKNPFAFAKDKAKRAVGFEKREEFWALRNLNFTVGRGEIVGVIGHNGAGKSTLLKILTGVTPPTEGEAILRGKLSSLLEVGTGFHPELTGRDNIFLNGAILGMTRKEIAKKFNQIVEFAGIEKFLDTPVKYYSSGMSVRLGFAVAAYLEPDILLVDEVLAVGDAEFQKKSIGKMGEVTEKEGRTILFVSHNLGAIQQLCKKTILLNKGHIEMFGETRAVIERYLLDTETSKSITEWRADHRYNDPYLSPTRMYLGDETGTSSVGVVDNVEKKYIYIEAEVETVDPSLEVGYALYSEDNQTLFYSFQTDREERHWPKIKQGKNILRGELPNRMLNEGTYRVELVASLHKRQWIFKPNNNNPTIHVTIKGGLSDSPYFTEPRDSILSPTLTWEQVA